MAVNHNAIRRMALALLCDETGVNTAAFIELKILLISSANQDLLLDIKEQNGRVFLPVDSGLFQKFKAA